MTYIMTYPRLYVEGNDWVSEDQNLDLLTPKSLLVPQLLLYQWCSYWEHMYAPGITVSRKGPLRSWESFNLLSNLEIFYHIILGEQQAAFLHWFLLLTNVYYTFSVAPYIFIHLFNQPTNNISYHSLATPLK